MAEDRENCTCVYLSAVKECEEAGEEGAGGVRGQEEMGMFCPVALGLVGYTEKRERKEDEKKVAKRCGAINMTKAAAKEVLKGLEGENRVGSLMGWTTNKEREKKCSRFFFYAAPELHLCSARWQRGVGKEEERDEE